MFIFFLLQIRISRGVSKQPNSNVHFFTSHFMTTLKDEGIQAVASWTANKNINVFDKKLIFIPINANLHWSLCVVVNPGHIANSFSQEGSPDQKRSWWVAWYENNASYCSDDSHTSQFLAAFCFWIHWECTTNKRMQSSFVNGWTVNGNALTREK